MLQQVEELKHGNPLKDRDSRYERMIRMKRKIYFVHATLENNGFYSFDYNRKGTKNITMEIAGKKYRMSLETKVVEEQDVLGKWTYFDKAIKYELI